MVSKHRLFTIYFSYLIACPLALISIRELRVASFDEKVPKGQFSFYGLVRNTSYWDSRQVVGFFDDLALAFPERKVFDIKHRDINAKGQFDTVLLETRTHLDFTGPNVAHAKSYIALETDFLGTLDTIRQLELVNLLRLRLAAAKLKWEHFSIIFGQYWHPMLTPECYVDTISYDSGGPIDLYVRSPQIRLTYYNKHLEFFCAATTELTSESDGPIGISSTYMRNAIVPNLHAQIQGKFKNHFIGWGIDYKRLVPRLKTNKDIKTSTALNSFATLIYAALNWPSFAFNAKLIYGDNLLDYNGLGGYAVSTVNPATDKRTYANLRNLSFWIDMAFKRKTYEPGLFIGVNKNLGATKPIIQSITNSDGIAEDTLYSFGANINTLFRINPRMRWFIKNFTIGTEFEYTRAVFGTINCMGRVDNTQPVGNTRLLFVLTYLF